MGDAAASPRAAPPKRRRGSTGDGAEMRRVAEIVMVLAAAGEVRGGKEPTAAERALAVEARERLVAAVAEAAVRPRDLFPGEAVRAVVEDLGLNRAKDPAAMGFRPPKTSIADRLLLTKRKMEEVKEHPVQPTAITPQATVSSGTAQFHGSHGAPMFTGALRNPPAVASLPANSPVTSASLTVLKAPGSSPVKPVTNPSTVALPHTGPLNLTRETVGPLNKSLHDTSARSNVNAGSSSNQVLKNQNTRGAAIQATTGNPVMGHHATPGTVSAHAKPTFANHDAIAKNVQHVLQQPANHPSWTPPSTEYMRARLDCQICKVAIMDADSLLVCDACERGAHLKCLQHYGNKGVPIADWHCPTCVAHSKGKPLPPKYGKVTRTVVASQAGPPGVESQFSVQGAVENTAAMENHLKVAANGNLSKPKSMQTDSTVHNSTVLALNAAAAGSQSQSISISRPAKANVNSVETSSTEMKENGKLLGSTAHHNVKSPDELESSELAAGSSTGTHSENSPDIKASSGLSLHSVDSANDSTQWQQSTAIPGVNCSDDYFAGTAEAKVKSEAHPEALLSRDAERVCNNGTSMDQTSNNATEEKMGTQATSVPDTTKDVEITTNIGSPIDQGSNVDIKEEVHDEPNCEPHTIKDVEMATSRTVIEEKLRADATSELHTTKDTEMTAKTVTAVDQTCELATEEKPRSEPTSAVKDVEMITDAGIPTDHVQLTNGITENGGEPPNEET